MKEIDRLLDVIKTLRGENGCPWDKEQTVQSMASSLIEETYELVEAIESNNNEDLQEELGDLLFLTLFISVMGEQEKRFQLDAVANGIADKLIRRHPHVFGDLSESNVDNIIVNWEAIKRSEKKNHKRKTPYDGIPAGLPEVQRLFKILDKTKRAGGTLPQVSLETLKDDMQSIKTEADKTALNGFIKNLFYFAHANKIDLPAIIRTASQDTMDQFLENPENNSK